MIIIQAQIPRWPHVFEEILLDLLEVVLGQVQVQNVHSLVVGKSIVIDINNPLAVKVEPRLPQSGWNRTICEVKTVSAFTGASSRGCGGARGFMEGERGWRVGWLEQARGKFGSGIVW